MKGQEDVKNRFECGIGLPQALAVFLQPDVHKTTMQNTTAYISGDQICEHSFKYIMVGQILPFALDISN